MLIDECDQEDQCNCSRKFRNDDHHRYILSNSHRLIGQQRLDLIPLMQTNSHHVPQILPEETRRMSISSHSMNMDDQPSNSNRRKKSASLNSPSNSGRIYYLKNIEMITVN